MIFNIPTTDVIHKDYLHPPSCTINNTKPHQRPRVSSVSVFALLAWTALVDHMLQLGVCSLQTTKMCFDIQVGWLEDKSRWLLNRCFIGLVSPHKPAVTGFSYTVNAVGVDSWFGSYVDKKRTTEHRWPRMETTQHAAAYIKALFVMNEL